MEEVIFTNCRGHEYKLSTDVQVLEPLIRLRKVSQPTESLQKPSLQILESRWLDRCAVVVIERNENVILFHRPPPPGLERELRVPPQKKECQLCVTLSRRLRRARKCDQAKPCLKSAAKEMGRALASASF